MNIYFIYVFTFLLLILCENLYFILAKHFKIVDVPSVRSSHNRIVLRGGGILFVISSWIYSLIFGIQYPWFMIGLSLISLISFIDDIHSLPDSVRLCIQIISTLFVFYQFQILSFNFWWLILLALVVYVGIINVYNFMDGINGMTAAYSISVLIPIYLLNKDLEILDQSFIVVLLLGLVIFAFYNFRSKGKAKCFAGDVGSVSMAYIVLFLLGSIILFTHDITYLIFLIVYGVDACYTIIHRILLHENLGQPHRKHVYQIMANELHINHVKVSSFYMILQLFVSLIFVYLIPNNIQSHFYYLIGVLVILSSGYLIFIKKYYYLHEDYINSLKN